MISMNAGESKKSGGDSGGFAALVPDAKRIAQRPLGAAKTKKRPAEPPAGSRAPSFRWPDPAQPRLAGAHGINDEQLMRLGRGEPDPDERIDLHNTRVDQAARLVADRIASAQARGLRCVLLVHGRGRGSATHDAPLRDAVPSWLTRGANARRVLAFAPAPNRLGGEGATMVLLRKPEAV